MGFVANNRHKTQLARRRWTALVAVFALIAQMLLPLGQALALDGGQGNDLQAMCLPNGFKLVPIEQNGTPTVPANAVPCPLCTLQLAPALPTPQDTATVIILDAPAHQVVFGLPLQHTRTSIWRDTYRPPRAPPISV